MRKVHANRRFIIGIVLLSTSLAIGACSGNLPNDDGAGRVPTEPANSSSTAGGSLTTEPPDSELAVVTDGWGREVRVPGTAERIVSLAPSNTEILFAIGAGDQVVGRDDLSDYPGAATQVESIGSTYGELNTEAILGLHPDLVLAAGITAPEHVEALEALELTVYVVDVPVDFQEVYDGILAIGMLTGREQDAQLVVEEMEAEYSSVVGTVEDLPPVKVFYEIDGSDVEAPWTTGSGTYQQLLIELANGENIAAEVEGWVQLSLEEIVVRDPEVIIFGGGPFIPTTVESLMARPGWGDLAAVRTGRVLEIDSDLLDLPGPRLVDGLRAVAEALHPEAFEQ